jgi:ribulose-5-phosphate 4-epimerase/fuculose-1-phosphate aldolase
MKLDRNINKDGRGKYALVNIRELDGFAEDSAVRNAFEILRKHGVVTLGNENPGQQFFVMKYKDRFTAPALFAYARAIRDYVRENDGLNNVARGSLLEFRSEIEEEAKRASILGTEIPD